ncbi:MAG TPA: class I SAM-dependent methyltransferase [Deferrisomatales bacterium]|nr:class I SAM-dependent methyltransferase [Deferrisomatales bacterium]
MTFEDLRFLAAGFQPAQLLLTALELGVFDALGAGARSREQLAADLGVDLRATGIACNALVSLGLLEVDDGGYRNAAGAQRFLCSASSEYRGSILRHIHATWEDWGALADTWRSARSLQARKDQQLPSSDAGLRHFILGMENLTRELAPQLAARLPVARCRKILDLGGGPGNYALAFALREPAAEVVHFDLEPTSAVAREFLSGRPGSERITFRAGDFLQTSLGDGYDLVWASQILHQLGEADLQRLLARIGSAMAPGGVLAIHEHFLNADKVSPRSAALFGVHMLAATRGGRTYSFEELEGWLPAAGFGPTERIDYGGASRILLARWGEP